MITRSDEYATGLHPYDIVRSGKWTIDKMFTMVKGTYKDLNGDGVKGPEDALGFISGYVWDDAFFWSSGLRTVDKTENGDLKLSDSFTGEQTVNLLNKLAGYYGSGNDWWHVRDDTGILYPFFTEGRTVFLQQSVNVMVLGYRDLPFTYGMVPVPKYNENQKDYITTVSMLHSLFMIPVDVSDENTDRAGAVLECLASESYRIVSPALFETALKVKYANDPDAGEMYDIMRANVSFDIGRLFTDTFDQATINLFRNAVRDNDTGWASKMASYRAPLEEKLATISEMYKSGK